MQKILVTGAAGFLGQALVGQLKKEGHEIYVIGHGVTDCYGFDGEIRILGEEIDFKNLQRLDTSIDTAYHFDGTSSVPVAQNDPEADRAKSLAPTQILVNYLENTAPQTCLVYASSAAVYGSAQSESPITEDANLKPISVYGSTKLACENTIRGSRLNSVIIRFFSIYGAGLRKQLFWDACNKAQKHDYHFFGAGNAYRDWIHVQDAIQLLRLVTRNVKEGQKSIYNGANGQRVLVSRALQLLFDSLGVKSSPIFDKGQKVGDPTGQCADIGKITALGYRQTISLEEGLRDYGDWFMRNKIDPPLVLV